MDNIQYVSYLKHTYIYCKVLYSMSFMDRVRLKFGTLKIDVSPDDSINRMSIKELELAIAKLKRPWWDWMFK